MSILDIIDKDKLKEILTEDNFEIIKKIYNEKTNEQKLEEVKKEIDKKYSVQEYIITEINITREEIQILMQKNGVKNTLIRTNM